MNKKIVALLIVLIAAVSIASVCAAELTKEKDFDGLFKMKIAGNDNFTSLDDGSNANAYSGVAQSNAAYKNASNTLFVFVYGDGMKQSIFYLTSGGIDFQYGKGTDLVKKDGDLTVFDGNLTVFNKSSDLNVDLTKFAGVSNDKDELSVIVAGNDANLVKEYAKTIVFNK